MFNGPVLRGGATTFITLSALLLSPPSVVGGQGSAGPVQQLIGGPGLDIDAAMSPDGKNVAYASSRSGNLEIWMRALDGGALFQITSSVDHSVDRYPVFLPDGKSIVFQSDRVSGTRNIWTISLGNRALAQLTSFVDGGASHPAVSPDGKTVCFTRTSANGDVSIWLMTVEGRDLRELSSGVDCSWTPTGQLVYAKGGGGDNPVRYDIWLSDVGGRDARPISAQTHTWSRSPTVSADGRWLVYTVYPSAFSSDIREVPGGFEIDPKLRTSLWLIDLNQPSRPPRQLVDAATFNSYAVFTRDNARLLFTSTRSGSADIWAISVAP